MTHDTNDTPSDGAGGGHTGDGGRTVGKNQVRELLHIIAAVDEFFDGMFAPLESWRPVLGAQVAERIERGLITGAELTSLVEAGAHGVLDGSARPIYGAGFCGSGRVVREGNPLAWWQGPDRTLLAASTFGPGQAAIDLSRLEWYRVPEATGLRHIAGPFVDYLCSNEITLTAALPLELEGEFAGVLCADVLVVALEDALTPLLREVRDASLVSEAGRVVISVDPDLDTGDRHPSVSVAASGAVSTGPVSTGPGDRPVAGSLAGTVAGSSADSAGEGEDWFVVRSERYPFALIVPAHSASRG